MKCFVVTEERYWRLDMARRCGCGNSVDAGAPSLALFGVQAAAPGVFDLH